LTVEEFEREVRDELAKYVRNPQVTVSVTQFRSETVTFTGAFRTPGNFSLQGRHTLTEMLAVIGGLADNASRILRITRQQSSGLLLLANARLHADGASYVADLDTTFVNSRSPADDFILKPYDVVTAFAVEPIVIGGEIMRAGIVPLGDHKSLPLLQVVLMSGGTTRDASKKHVKIFRQEPDSGRRDEIDVDLAKIQKGGAPDVALLPRDLVIIPRADGRLASRQILAITTGVALSALAAMMVSH
jgi:polysaccharide export outer membrane protein